MRYFEIARNGTVEEVGFQTPEDFRLWCVENHISTSVVNALWAFQDVKQWLTLKGAYSIRNKPQ
jgi:hypothetical protein